MSQNFYFKLIVPIILCCSTRYPRSGRSSTEKSIQGGLYCISGFLHLSGMDVNIPEMNCCHSVKTNLITNSPSRSFNISFHLSSSIIIGVRIGGELLRDKSSCNQHCLFWFEFRLLETAAPGWAERLLPSLSLSVSLFFLLRGALIFPPGCVQEMRLTSEESGMKRSLLSPNPVRQSKGLWDAMHDRKTGIKTEGSDYELDGWEREGECENHSRQCLHLAFCLNASYSHCRTLDRPTENHSVYSCLILIHLSLSQRDMCRLHYRKHEHL